MAITVYADCWSRIVHPINRENFNTFLVSLISKYITKFSDISDQTVITLPSIVGKKDRYSIHRLNVKDHFKTDSQDTTEGERIMKIILSKKYTQELFYDYDFGPTPVPEQAPTDKEVLFKSLLSFIQTNLNDEFEKYLSTI